MKRSRETVMILNLSTSRIARQTDLYAAQRPPGTSSKSSAIQHGAVFHEADHKNSISLLCLQIDERST